MNEKESNVFFLNFLAVWARLKLEGVAQFSLSPGRSPAVAVFIPEKNVSFKYMGSKT